MRGFLDFLRISDLSLGRVKVDDGLYELYEGNDLFRYEVDRYFRRLVSEFAPGSIDLVADLFFKGDHTLDARRHLFPRVEYYPTITTGTILSTTGEVHRLRRKATVTDLAPAQPGQIAYALGRLACVVDLSSIHSPEAVLSQVDINLNQIGSVFGHPAGRRALFNETAVVPTGVGDVVQGGTLNLGADEDGHYVYDVRITEDGDDASAEYFFRRRPYLKGAFEPGEPSPDNSTGAETLLDRMDVTDSRSTVVLTNLVPTNETPTPAAVSYDVDFPTALADSSNLTSRCCGSAFDGQTNGRMWFAYTNIVDNGDVNATASRALWAWKRFTGEAINRYDAAASAGGDATMPNFPTLGADAQFRDLRAGRNGILYLAADGLDDDGNGTSGQGALIQFDTKPISGTGDTITQDTPVAGTARLDDAAATFPTNIVGTFITITGATAAGNNGTFRITARNSATQIEFENEDAVTVTESFTWELADSVVGVTAVYGTTVTGIYTVNGLLNNDVLAVTVDTTESYASAGDDRVWVLHRDGLTFFDVTVATGAAGARSTVADAGADFNIVDANSIRGLAGFQPPGSLAEHNGHQALLDHDSNGDIYYVSTQTGGSFSAGINRLNRIIGDASAHTFYSLDTSAEGGAAGFLDMGNDAPGTVVGTIIALQVHRRDAGDPADDDIWVSTGYGNNNVASRNIQQIPIGDWGGGDNPGIGYFGNTLSNSATNTSWYVQVAPDGEILIGSTNSTTVGILESLGRYETDTGTGDTITQDTPIAGTATLDDAGASFTTTMLGKRIRISGASNAGNNGSFVVTAVNSGTQIEYTNASAVTETSSFTWDFTGVDFDTQSTVGGAVGSWTNGTVMPGSMYQRVFTDASGIVWAGPTRSTSVVSWLIHHLFALTWQFSGSVWYRSRAPHIEQVITDGTSRTAHTTQEELTGGVSIAFADSGAGGTEFVGGEYYTFSASRGLIKTATQELSYSYDIFHERTRLFDRGDEAAKTAATQTAAGGFIDVGSLASVTTDDPFGLTASEAAQLAHFQRRLGLDGTNNTETLQFNGTINTTNGFQVGLDIGSDSTASVLRFGITDMNSDNIENIQIDLYSATAADTPSSWGSPRATYRSDQDAPEWNLSPDGNHNLHGSTYQIGNMINIEVDLDALETNGNLANPGTNDAMRYWKMVIYRHTGSLAHTAELIGCAAYDSSGLPIGVTSANYLTQANETNFLAVFPIRFVFIQDEGTGTTASRGPSDNQVTLTADAFDIFKSGTGDTITQDTPIAGTATLDDAGAAGTDAFTSNDVGRYIRISGASNSGNNGLFPITAVNSGTQIEYTNASAVTETSSFSWTLDGVAPNDFFRELDSNGLVVQERIIDTVDSETQLTMTLDLDAFTTEDWEVVRNADVRARDDEGGGEDQAEFPPSGASGQSQVFLCGVTAWIAYNDDDITAGRQMRAERYVEVFRGA